MSFMRGASAIPNLNGLTFKTITGTTPATEGSSIEIAHGLLLADIVAWQSRVSVLSNAGFITQSNNSLAGNEFQVFAGPDGMFVQLDATNSELVLSRPISIVIWFRAT